MTCPKFAKVDEPRGGHVAGGGVHEPLHQVEGERADDRPKELHRPIETQRKLFADQSKHSVHFSPTNRKRESSITQIIARTIDEKNTGSQSKNESMFAAFNPNW